MTPQEEAEWLGIRFAKQEPGYLAMVVRTGDLLITSGHVSDLEGQQQAVDRGPTASRDDLPDDLIDHLVLDRAGRRGPGHHRRCELVAEPLGAGDESPHLVVGVPPDGQQGFAASQAPLLEPAPIGRQRRRRCSTRA